ncbi:hypothetical protein RJT34_32576 [Clitoria ternatea]|uniref:Uncharacterized protein n=1 Tax=Clitoria ternatea TaxID=43366 RepID=A0AAN9EWA9_CLITE
MFEGMFITVAIKGQSAGAHTTGASSSTPHVPQSYEWYPDSGASHNVTANPHLVRNRLELDGCNSLYMGLNFSDGYQATAVVKALATGGTSITYKKLSQYVVFEGPDC